MKERRNWTPPTNTKKAPSYTKMTAERMFDIHRIGKTNEFTTATYPKIFITNLIQWTFRSKINLIVSLIEK